MKQRRNKNFKRKIGIGASSVLLSLVLSSLANAAIQAPCFSCTQAPRQDINEVIAAPTTQEGADLSKKWTDISAFMNHQFRPAINDTQKDIPKLSVSVPDLNKNVSLNDEFKLYEIQQSYGVPTTPVVNWSQYTVPFDTLNFKKGSKVDLANFQFQGNFIKADGSLDFNNPNAPWNKWNLNTVMIPGPFTYDELKANDLIADEFEDHLDQYYIDRFLSGQ